MSMQPTYRPVVEPLESRELLTTGIQAYVTGGNLYVLGTPGNDFINIAETNNQISVAGAQITVGGRPVAGVDAASISKVIVYGNGGDDFINLGTVKNDATIYAGSGSDTIRCGPGNETVNSGGGFDRVFHPFNANQPVVNGTSVADIRQGQNPLCQTDAALAEAVKEGHDFSGDIHYLGNHLYNVKLHGNVPSQKVYFDGWTNNNDPVVANGEFWTVLLQRARLQSLGIDPSVQHTMTDWNAFNQNDHGRLYSIAEALYFFTGSASAFYSVGNANPQTLQADLAQGDFVIALSFSAGGSISRDGIVGNHAYAVLAVYNEAGVWKVRLYNPWGMDRDNGATLDALDKSHPAANDGVITLTWQQFTSTSNFKGFFVAAKK
jgi:hypothetical protein